VKDARLKSQEHEETEGLISIYYLIQSIRLYVTLRISETENDSG
jgi:hypothetical protein